MLRTRAPLTIASPFDLHVLGPPQTFALSQDQTLQFELALIMAEQLVGAARPVVGVALLFSQRGGDPTGCGLEVHVPTSVVLVSLFHYPVFRERLAATEAVRGVGDLCSLSRLVKFFLVEIFSSPPRSAGLSFGLLSGSGGPGGSKGGGVYPVPCSPSSAFSRWSLRPAHRVAEAPGRRSGGPGLVPSVPRVKIN